MKPEYVNYRRAAAVMVSLFLIFFWGGVCWLSVYLWSLLFGALPGSIVIDGRLYLQCGQRLVPVRYEDKDGKEIRPKKEGNNNGKPKS